MKDLFNLTIQELFELKQVTQSIVNDYDSKIELHQNLNNLVTVERRMADKDFVQLCNERTKFNGYKFQVCSVLEKKIENFFNEE